VQVTTANRFRKFAAWGAGAALALGLWVAWGRTAGWESMLVYIGTMQADLHRQLATAVRHVAQDGWMAAWPLVGISLLYGVFHAAGPGHGKAVIATYLGTTPTRLQRGLFLSVASALAQGLVAIMLVEVVVGLLGYSLRRTQGSAAQLETLSFALLAMVGVVLAVRSARLLYQRWQRARRPAFSLLSGDGRMKAYCADCGGAHLLTEKHIDQPLNWRTSLPIILAIGMRPCTGAILVLLVAHSLGLRWVGMAAVLAMSLGTAATVSVLATAAVSLRHGVLRLVGLHASSQQRVGLLFDMLGLLGGMIICLAGLVLLRQGLQAPAHPLF